MAVDPLGFGPFRYDAALALLFREGELVALGGRAQRLLAHLLAHRGEIVSKADLIDAAWPEQAIEESNLSVQIAQLRKVIGDGWIRTVERVGYQFVPGASRGHIAAVPILAVPRFMPGNDVALAVHSELSALLSAFGAFAVSAADDAAADYILRGVVRRTGAGMRLSVHLLATSDGRIVWGCAHDAGPTELGALLERLAATVETEVNRAEISRVGRENPQGESPYHLYQRGRALFLTSRSSDNAKAFRLFEAAAAAEPDNPTFLGAACEALAGQRIPMGWEPMTDNDYELSHAMGMRGLALGNADAGDRALFGLAIFRGGDPDFGHWITRDAVARNPNSILALISAGNVTRNWSDANEARAYMHRALSLNPADPLQRFSLTGLAALDSADGLFEDALVWARRAFAMNQNHAAMHWQLISARAHLGQLDVARRHAERLLTLHPGTTLDRINAGQPSRNGHTRSVLQGLAQAGVN